MNIDEKLEESIENKYMKDDKGKNKMELTIEESVYILKRKDFNTYVEDKAIETLLTAYEKEKELLELASNMLDNIDYDQIPIAIGELKSELEKEKEKNKKARDMIEYYLIENNSLNDFDKRNKELRKLKKVLEE